MCYSGKCLFENYAGYCTVHDCTKFREELGMNECIVGESPCDPDDERYIQDHANDLRFLRRLAEYKRLVGRY